MKNYLLILHFNKIFYMTYYKDNLHIIFKYILEIFWRKIIMECFK